MDCCICSDQLFDGKNKLKAATCGHVFHLNCWNDANKNGITLCPLCRKRLMYRHAGPFHLSSEDVPRPIELKPEKNDENVHIEPVTSSHDGADMAISVENSAENDFEPVDALMVDETCALLATPSNSDQASTAHCSTSNDPVFAIPPPASRESESSGDHSKLANESDLANNNVQVILHKMAPDQILQNVDRNNDVPSTSNQARYDRNVRINSTQRSDQHPEIELRSSNCVSVPVQHYSVGLVKCFVCRKTFREDLAIEHYTGRIACSFECFRKAN